MKSNSAFGIPGFKILSELYQSTSCAVFRAERVSDGKKAVLKTLNPAVAGDVSRARYFEEYSIAQRDELRSVVRAIDCISFEDTVAIVFEDTGGVTLAELMNETSFNLSDCLEIGIHPSATLREIHAHGIVHKDLNPFHLVMKEDGRELRLTDFGSASVLTKDHPNITDV
ncbi:MAG: protein kinase, partial [Deltaproteobacteria bacterium]|nr:protein kinase [Deltaproteobacteria bacterium]